MKKIFPVLFIFLIILIFFRQFLLSGFLPIPSDDLIGLYHPFRDLYAKTNPNGIPYKNYLITDPIRQQYPWRFIVIAMEKLGQLPLWNPYSFAGYPLLANFQSAPFYPLNIFFFLLPFHFAWSLLIILQPFLGAIFLFFYLQSLRLDWRAGVLGALAFCFSGFFVAWLEWNTVLQVVIWLPLILLAKDKLLRKWTIGWGFIFFFAEVCEFLGGHIQVLFYSLCISNLYLFVRISQKAKKEKKSSVILSIFRIYIPFLLVGIAILVVTAAQWLPTLQFIQFSARSVDQNPFTTQGWFLPWQHLVQFVAPDFFGNPATLNYWGIWNYAEFVGYIGIIPLLFAMYALFFRHDKKTFFFSVLFFLSLLFALPTPVAVIPFLLKIPFLSTSQPTRLLYVTDFSLAILAAVGADYFLKKQDKKILIIIGFFALLFGGLWVFVLKEGVTFAIPLMDLQIAKQNLIFPSVTFVAFAVLVMFFLLTQQKKNVQYALLFCLTILFVFDIVRFAEKFIPFTPAQYLFPQTQTISFLQNNLGNYRYMTTDSQIFPPNVSSYYHLQSVDGYDPLYLLRYGELVVASERGKPDINEPFGFNRIITPHSYNSRIMDLLGVKYVLSLHEEKNPALTKVFQEGQTRIFENKNVLPRAFFVNKVIQTHSDQETIENIFNMQYSLNDVAFVQDTIPPFSPTKGTVRILAYSPNSITINTNNSADGFLVLTDTFYPTWQVAIDGNKTSILQTDLALRGVYVPKGVHRVVFSDRLL
ncbi:MAG TPA: YfhO family protein [Patescibacteria group bacterium]|nr:YfhO family protein [Patescibacteria group bacterium]